MAFVDEIELELCSGDGGDGIVSWLRLKNMAKGGPAGGDGGKGGDVYFEACEDLDALARYVKEKRLSAQNGAHGRGMNRKGKNGEDLIIKVPIGSQIKWEGGEFELLKAGERVMVLKGGVGGFGNTRFKSSVNRRPQKCSKGSKGRCAIFKIELASIADVGIVGMPNAGKSTLLNAICGSKAKVGDYPFTTLNPNLSLSENIIFADIPGLIEDASSGKGLGIKFLKHIKRTKLILHCISAEKDDIVKTYSVIRDELARYDEILLKKPEIIVLSKSDILSEEEISAKLKELEQISPHFLAVSSYRKESVHQLKEKVKEVLKNL